MTSKKDKLDEFEIDFDEPVFTTTVVSRLLDVPVWVLKRLDTAGVVSPPRETGQARLYSKRELMKVKKVWHLMEERHVTINGVKVILEIEEKFESEE